MEIFLSALVTLLVIIDPLGHAAMYGAMTANATVDERRRIARKSTLIATGVLLFFGLFGAALIGALGISLEAFRIAGGILLFVIAFRMLMGHHDLHNIEDNSSVYNPAHATEDVRNDISVFPLAIPLLAGPGGMTAIILLANQTPHWEERAFVFIAMLLALLTAYVSMLAAGRIVRIFGAGGIQIMARLMGILLAALAIQFIADGAKGLGFGG